MAKVCVVIPAYNAASTIAETLESVLAQRYRDVEIVVVDDGSTDATAEVVGRFPGVVCIQKKNGGQASARNTGINATNAEYIAFLDADDLWLPGKLEIQMEQMISSGMQWSYTDGVVFDGDNGKDLSLFSVTDKPYSGQIHAQLLQNCFVSTLTVVVKRSVLEDVGLFDESPIARNREDWDLWLRISRKYEVVYVDEPLVRYRQSVLSNTGNEDPEKVLNSKLYVLNRGFDGKKDTPEYKSAAATLYLRAGKKLLLRGNTRLARKMMATSLSFRPGQLKGILFWIASLLPPKAIRYGIQIRNRRS